MKTFLYTYDCKLNESSKPTSHFLGPTCCLKAHVENPLFIWRSNQSHIVLSSLPVLSEPCHHHKINDLFNALAVLGQWCYRTHMFEERRWVLGEWCGHITPVSFTFPVPSSLVPSVGWVGLNSEFISLLFFFKLQPALVGNGKYNHLTGRWRSQHYKSTC